MWDNGQDGFTPVVENRDFISLPKKKNLGTVSTEISQ